MDPKKDPGIFHWSQLVAAAITIPSNALTMRSSQDLGSSGLVLALESFSNRVRPRSLDRPLCVGVETSTRLQSLYECMFWKSPHAASSEAFVLRCVSSQIYRLCLRLKVLALLRFPLPLISEQVYTANSSR